MANPFAGLLGALRPAARSAPAMHPALRAAIQVGNQGRVHGLSPALVDKAVQVAMQGAVGAKATPTFGRVMAEHAGKELFGTLGRMASDAHKLHLERALNPVVQHSPIAGMLTNMGAVVGAGALMAGGSMVMDHMKSQASYQKMLKLYPELAREQPERVRTYFEAVTSASPAVASQPLVAGSLIKRMLNYDGFDPSTFQDLIATQSNINKGRAEVQKHMLGAGLDTMKMMHTYGIGADPNR